MLRALCSVVEVYRSEPVYSPDVIPSWERLDNDVIGVEL